MRDLQHWKDKVELSLDGRQLFFLFFGGATLACLLFTLGVMTGRRIEARAIALDAPTTEDPLAALDQLGDLEDDELTYHRALTKDTRPGQKPKDVVVDGDGHGRPARTAVPAKPEAPAPVRKPESKPGHAALDVDEVPAAKPVSHGDSNVVLASASVPAAPVPAVASKGDKDNVPAASTKDPALSQAHFTLQLSAFAARRDADEFMHRVQNAGYRAFVVASDVPGKGVLYRVRVGDYASRDAASMEKAALEKKLHVSAYLARL